MPCSFFCVHCLISVLATDALSFGDVAKRSRAIREDLIQWRRELHQMPEIMYQEFNTSGFIQSALLGMGISFTTGWGKNTREDRIPGPGGTGVVAEIGTGEQPIVALRADMDALPMEEEVPVPFRSKRFGMMHACGHDAHTTMLLGAAKLLSSVRDSELKGTVRLIFQPAEEGGGGAKRMVEEGVMKNVSRILGFHMDPGLPSSHIGGRAGTLYAAGDFFEMSIVGRGGHAALPQRAIDPVIAAAAAVQALQNIVSREIDPMDTAVLSVTKLHAGDAYNVIPDHAVIGGTIRAMTDASLEYLRHRVVDVVRSVASMHRCLLHNVTFMADHFLATRNHPVLWEWLSSEDVGFKDHLVMHWDMPPDMSSDDFSYFGQHAPAAYIALGQGSNYADDEKKFPTNAGLHSPRFALDEDVLELGSAIHAHFALQSLRFLSNRTVDIATVPGRGAPSVDPGFGELLDGFDKGNAASRIG